MGSVSEYSIGSDGLCILDRTEFQGQLNALGTSSALAYLRLALTSACTYHCKWNYDGVPPHTFPFPHNCSLPHTLPSDPSGAPPQTEQRTDGAYAEDAGKGPAHPGGPHLPTGRLPHSTHCTRASARPHGTIIRGGPGDEDWPARLHHHK